MKDIGIGSNQLYIFINQIFNNVYEKVNKLDETNNFYRLKIKVLTKEKIYQNDTVKFVKINGTKISIKPDDYIVYDFVTNSTK